MSLYHPINQDHANVNDEIGCHKTRRSNVEGLEVEPHELLDPDK